MELTAPGRKCHGRWRTVFSQQKEDRGYGPLCGRPRAVFLECVPARQCVCSCVCSCVCVSVCVRASVRAPALRCARTPPTHYHVAWYISEQRDKWNVLGVAARRMGCFYLALSLSLSSPSFIPCAQGWVEKMKERKNERKKKKRKGENNSCQ